MSASSVQKQHFKHKTSGHGKGMKWNEQEMYYFWPCELVDREGQLLTQLHTSGPVVRLLPQRPIGGLPLPLLILQPCLVRRVLVAVARFLYFRDQELDVVTHLPSHYPRCRDLLLLLLLLLVCIRYRLGLCMSTHRKSIAIRFISRGVGGGGHGILLWCRPLAGGPIYRTMPIAIIVGRIA